MQRPGDELLVAYLDGELDELQRAQVEGSLHRDPALRDRVAELAESAALLRAAFDETLREPVPERLIAAARGETAATTATSTAGSTILPFPRRSRVVSTIAQNRRWWVSVAVAASLFGLVIGGVGVGYLDKGTLRSDKQQVADASAASTSGSWLDNIAGYHKLFVSTGDSGDGGGGLDIASNADNGEVTSKISQRIAQGIRLPDLKPWGLTFKGARYLVVEGRPAAQLYYTTDNKAIGPLTIVIASSKRPDLAPTFDHRQDVNLLYWRHHGRAYAIVGQADIGYMWGLANDIAWQMDAI
jgi:anti-sigma factor RsiW